MAKRLVPPPASPDVALTTIAESLPEIKNSSFAPDKASKDANQEPVDLVAILMGCSIIRSPYRISPSTHGPKAELWICDFSYHKEEARSVKISIFGYASVSRLYEEQVSAGDVLRFRGLVPSATSGGGAPDSFRLSFSPQDNSGWNRIGRINDTRQQQQQGHANDIASLCTEDPIARTLSLDRQTSKKDVDDLLKRYHQYILRNPKFSIKFGLPPLPTRRRTLRELRSIPPGCISNVNAVRVCECSRHVLSSTSRGGTKRSETIIRATITEHEPDDSGDADDHSMMLVSIGGDHYDSLRKASKNSNERMPYLLTHLLSVSRRDVDERAPTAVDENVLVTTRSTTVVTLSAKSATRKDLSSNNEASSSLSSVDDLAPSLGPQTVSNTVVIASSLSDILVNGVSMEKSGMLNSIRRFQTAMMTSSHDYRSTKMVLSGDAIGSETAMGSVVAVRAKPEVMQTLCCGANVRDIDESMLSLLRALLREDILLHWSVQDEAPEGVKQNLVVVKVVLPKL